MRHFAISDAFFARPEGTQLALKMARVFGVTIEALFELEDTD